MNKPKQLTDAQRRAYLLAKHKKVMAMPDTAVTEPSKSKPLGKESK